MCTTSRRECNPVQACGLGARSLQRLDSKLPDFHVTLGVYDLVEPFETPPCLITTLPTRCSP